MKKVKRVLSLLLACCLVAGMLPIVALAEDKAVSSVYLMDVCSPYKGIWYSLKDSFIMSGQTYKYGFTMGDEGNLYFNLGGKYEWIEFDVGHEDGSGMSDLNIHVYLDGELAETIRGIATEPPRHISFPLDNANEMRIELEYADYNPGYGFANIMVYTNDAYHEHEDESGDGIIKFQEHSYQLISTKMSWVDAKAYCEGLGGHLVTITSQAEQDFVCESFTKKYGTAMIGLSDAANEGDWIWVTGEVFSYSNWDSGEPNNEGDEDYILMNSDGTWNDGHLEREKWIFICEWESSDVEGIRSDFVNAGPGEKYARENGFENTQVIPVSVENGYCEIEYYRDGSLRRDYIKKELVSGTEKVPIVSSTIIQGPNTQQYIYKVPVNANTVKETKVYTGPTDKYAVRDTLAEGEPITFLYVVNADSLISAHRSYAIEYKTSKGLKRGYVLNHVYNDIMNDPLKGFDKDKTNNAAFIYENEIVHSSFSATDCSRVSLLNNWSNASHVDFTFLEKFDWWAGITAAISGNTGDAPEDNFSAVTDGISMLINFFSAAIKNTAVSVNIDKCKGERRIVIHTGSPIESDYAGKSTYLSSILAQPGSYTISEDEWIRRAFTGLKPDGKYSMHLTFSKDFSSCPYGYSLVVKKDGSVWAYPIIHSGTSFKVYWEKDGKREYAFDAASIWGRQAAKLSDDKATQLISELDKHSFKLNKSQEAEKNFTDVSPNTYYYDAVQWAVENGITTGTSDTTFSPENTCTRGQVCTFLYRAAGEPPVSGTTSVTDISSSDYYYNAVLWAAGNGMFSGSTFSPNSPCTRSMAINFMWKYAGRPIMNEGTPFTDISASDAQAVAWALEQGVTNGTSDTTFSPDTTCTRGQIVTFLYRAFAD